MLLLLLGYGVPVAVVVFDFGKTTIEFETRHKAEFEDEKNTTFEERKRITIE